MSGPPNSSGPFSFGKTATSGSGASGLFGTVTTNNNPTGSTFGTGTANTAGQGSSIFGQNKASSTIPSASSFGSTPATSAPATSLFGSGASTSIFGGGSSGGGNVFGGGTSKPTGSAIFSTPSKPVEALNTGPVQNANIFGGGPAASSASLFGNTSTASTTSSQPGNSTPAASKPSSAFSFGTVSTTPAGPPPTGNVAQSTTGGAGINFSIIGGATAKSATSAISMGGSNIFGGAPQSGTSNTFGKPPNSSGSSTLQQNNSSPFNLPSQNTNVFATTPTPSSGSVSGATNPSPFPNSSIGQESSKQVSQPPSSSASLFSILGGQKPLGQSSAPPSSPFVLNGNSGNPPSSSSGASFNIPTFSLSQSSTPNTSTPTTSAPTALGGTNPGASNIFGSLAGAPVGSSASTQPSSSSTAPASTTAQASSGRFGSSKLSLGGASEPPAANGTRSSVSEVQNATTQPSGNSTTTAAGNDTNRLNANLGTSTSGPRPPAQSRLKNKSMDEIITRWASDLSKYQKEFQRQAMKVSEWDRMLVDNSERIQKLYGSTLEAERATVEVERQLSVVENDQGELESWLDHYERQVDELIATQIGQGDTIQGPDQERERTYKLAEKLADRLNEMGKDLTSMVENINDVSSNLSKNGKSDDALSQIVRVLNGHLSQLQHIDQGAAALQTRVIDAQKASRNFAPMNGMNGIRSDAADDFYRSYMGRR
ncbi:FG-nucleoporin nsp1 [Xylographa opegraphella]|nr:FG-nucleoporin nsp1 [Xylographa opegraphella]